MFHPFQTEKFIVLPAFTNSAEESVENSLTADKEMKISIKIEFLLRNSTRKLINFSQYLLNKQLSQIEKILICSFSPRDPETRLEMGKCDMNRKLFLFDVQLSIQRANRTGRN